MKDKGFDAVWFMRQARDKMTSDMAGMSFEEQKKYIEQRASKLRRDIPLQRENGSPGVRETDQPRV